MATPPGPKVDVVVLTRASGRLHPDVEQGLRTQRHVQVVLHRIVGEAQPHDSCRYETIARARNNGKQCGDAAWLMFVDDDVVLEPDCVGTLVGELSQRPVFAALAVDYLGECRTGEISPHIAMGATLFRREALDQISFTWGPDTCECRCCCDDLRRLHWGIDYCRSARARHLESVQATVAECHPSPSTSAVGHVLAAFNRRHWTRFEQQFLHSLRASGNEEPVVAAAMGLYPSERARLGRLPSVSLLYRPDNGLFVGRQRLEVFPAILETLPPETPVAYWDVGDVIFQGRLELLWEIVQRYPDKVLAVREPAGYPDNPAIIDWTHGIHDHAARQRVQELLFNYPFLNAGFMAGSARTLLEYFRTVADWYNSPTLAGSSDHGDQIALNLYCHSNPENWQEVSESWNYCLALRSLQSVYRAPSGQYVDVLGLPIYAVHGNASTLREVPFRRPRFAAARR